MHELQIIAEASLQIARNFAPGIVVGLVIVMCASFRADHDVTLTPTD